MAAKRPQVRVAFVPAEAPQPAELPLHSHPDTRIGWRASAFAQALLLMVLAAGVYIPALWGSFAWLDDRTVSDNLVLRTWGRGLTTIWVHPTVLPHYQPLAYTALLVEFKLFATRLPSGYLLVNLLLHAVNVLLLWTLLRRIAIPGALTAAAVFAVHPINVEAVAWISQQPLLLCGMFALSAMLVHLRFSGIDPTPPDDGRLVPRLPSRPAALYALSLALFVAAVMSHSAAVTLPVLVGLLIWWKRRIRLSDWLGLAPMLAGAVIWTILIAGVIDPRRAAAINSPIDTSALDRLLVAGTAVWVYLWHVLWPVGLSFAYAKWTAAWWQASFGLAALATLAGLWLARERVGRGPFASAAGFSLLILPALGVFRTDLDLYSDVADHLAYLASAAVIAPLVAAAMQRPMATRAPVFAWLRPAAACVMVLTLAGLTLWRVPDYRSTRSMWLAALRKNPNSAIAHNTLGLLDLQDGKISPAMEHFLRASQADPRDPRAYLNMAAAYEADGAYDKALMSYYQAMRLAPQDVEINFGLARVLAMQGSSAEAVREYQLVLQRQPTHLRALNNLGLLHADRGEIQQSIACFQRAIQIDPGFWLSYINLAGVYYGQGQIEQAAQTLTRVVQMDPNNFEAFLNAGAMCARLNDYEKAEILLRHAVRLRPGSTEAYQNLGLVLSARGNQSEALYCFDRAVELDPNNVVARANAQRLRQRLSASPSPSGQQR
ncbi:tetratricopeptide repeat protein [Fontivita pretiosa]|uniref:tetratricopeptide repeat protein n=1 Tax=Fontivita pretiosa TaxID=2989684 RepID=UPI003D172D99